VPAPLPIPEPTLPEALKALQQVLREDSTADDSERRALLARVLDLVAAGGVSQQVDAEASLAQLLVNGAPRTDGLLEPCIRRFGWEAQESTLAPDPAVIAVLERWSERRLLSALASGTDADSRAFRRLARPARPLLRFWRAQLGAKEHCPELRLLRRLRREQPGLLQELDPAQLAWWERFEASLPKLSAVLLGISLALAPVLGVLGVVTGLLLVMDRAPWQRILTLELILLVLIVLPLVLAVGKLFILDRPASAIARRWGTRLPRLVLTGWLPLLITGLAVALALPGRGWVLPAAWAAGAAGCLWAFYVSWPVERGRLNDGIGGMLLLLLGLWWIGSISGRTGGSSALARGPATVSALALVGAPLLGERALETFWMRRLDEAQRRRFTAGLLACGAAIIALIATSAASKPLVLGMVVSFVVMHQIPSVMSRAASRGAAGREKALLAATAGVLVVLVAVHGSVLTFQVSAILLVCTAGVRLVVARHAQ
jgi:hypothetical protein